MAYGIHLFVPPALDLSNSGQIVPQALPIGDLGKRHAVILVETGILIDLEVAVVAIHALTEDMKRKKLRDLRENIFSGMHDQAHKDFSSKDVFVSGKVSSSQTTLEQFSLILSNN
jgi:hypothetical protein